MKASQAENFFFPAATESEKDNRLPSKIALMGSFKQQSAILPSVMIDFGHIIDY